MYKAKTYAELEPVLSDLPSERPRVDLRKEEERPAPPPPPQSPNLVAIFGGVDRKGRWLVEETTNVTCVFGGATLDFRQAVLSRGQVTVNITCMFGGVDVIVPPGVRVVGSNVAIFGGNDMPEDDNPAPDAPVIRVTGLTLFGGVSVRRKALDGKRRKSARANRIPCPEPRTPSPDPHPLLSRPAPPLPGPQARAPHGVSREPPVHERVT